MCFEKPKSEVVKDQMLQKVEKVANGLKILVEMARNFHGEIEAYQLDQEVVKIKLAFTDLVDTIMNQQLKFQNTHSFEKVMEQNIPNSRQNPPKH